MIELCNLKNFKSSKSCVINVYSKSEHELGRLLSNFAHTPFIGGKHQFASVEAWWYWFITGKQHDHLKALYGWKAKQEGRKYPRTGTIITPEILKQVYHLKLNYNLKVKQMLLNYNGIFDHYYVYNKRKVPATKWLWTAQLWEEIRTEIQGELS